VTGLKILVLKVWMTIDDLLSQNKKILG